jgi:hypothetical protein
MTTETDPSWGVASMNVIEPNQSIPFIVYLPPMGWAWYNFYPYP